MTIEQLAKRYTEKTKEIINLSEKLVIGVMTNKERKDTEAALADAKSEREIIATEIRESVE